MHLQKPSEKRLNIESSSVSQWACLQYARGRVRCQSQWKCRIVCWVRGASSSRARQHHLLQCLCTCAGGRSDRTTQACSSRLLVLGQYVAVDFLTGRLLVKLWQQRRCGFTLANCCCSAGETLRRHILRLLLRQQRRCGVTLSDCCCGSRDVAASRSQTAVAAAVTLRRHTRRLMLRQQRRCSFQNSPLKQRWSQRCPGIDCESSSSGQRLGKCLWSRAPQIRRWYQNHRNLLQRVIASQVGVIRITRLRPQHLGCLISGGVCIVRSSSCLAVGHVVMLVGGIMQAVAV